MIYLDAFFLMQKCIHYLPYYLLLISHLTSELAHTKSLDRRPVSFTYQVDDGSGTTVGGTVNVTINPVNDLPVPSSDNVSLAEDTPLTITLASLLSNDNDIDADSLTVDTSKIGRAWCRV